MLSLPLKEECAGWATLPDSRQGNRRGARCLAPRALPRSLRSRGHGQGTDVTKTGCPSPWRAVNKQIPSYLKLVTEVVPEPAGLAREDLAAFDHVCRAYERATGWRMQYVPGLNSSENSTLMWTAPVNPGVGTSPGHIRVFSTFDQAGGTTPRVPFELASPLAEAVGGLWGELLSTRHALWQRESELAVAVPVSVQPREDQTPSLGSRLEGVLRGGAEAIGCQAAGLYLLDPATTELKLRSAWGLSRKRLAEPARPLRGSLADLEALMGHAVVLTDDRLHEYWKVPEPGFVSCVCVPVSSATMPLGTLWAFCREERDFTDVQTNLWEVVAGRIAADLERQVLVDEALTARDQSKQIAAAERSQQDQLPRVTPMVNGWDVAAKAYHKGPVGGAFYDWFASEEGGLSIVAGEALQGGVEGAMTASALRGAARACATRGKQTQLLLETANSILWTGSAGDAGAGMFHARVEPDADSLSFSAAGPMRMLAVSDRGCSTLGGPSPALGRQEELRLQQIRRQFGVGELLLVYGTGFLTGADEEMLSALDEQLALSLESKLHLPAGQLVEFAGDVLQAYPAFDGSDRVLLVVKRRAR